MTRKGGGKGVGASYTRCPDWGPDVVDPPTCAGGIGGGGDIGVDTLLLEVGPKVVKADIDLFGELAQIGPILGSIATLLFPFPVCRVVSMTIGVVKGV